MIQTKITKKRVKDHFAYALWKYLILVVASVFGWNLIYTATAYRPPRDKKVDIYFVTYGIDSDTLAAFEALAAPHFPDMEALNFLSIGMGDAEDYYGTMQLTTYVGAQEGDIYIMTRDLMRSYAESGLFVPLNDAISEGIIQLRGIDVAEVNFQISDPEYRIVERGIYAIPAKTLYGLIEYGIDNRDLYIGVTAYSQNQPNALKMVDWFIETFQTEKPQWLIEYEEQNPIPEPTDTVLPSY